MNDLLISYAKNQLEKSVSLSSKKGEETEQLKFYSDENGISIVSSVIEKYGDEPTYLNIKLDEQEFKQLLAKLHRLVHQDKQILQS